MPQRPASQPELTLVLRSGARSKTSVGAKLAQELQAPFIDGDDLHPPYNIAKMSRGDPLNDQVSQLPPPGGRQTGSLPPSQPLPSGPLQ